MKKLIGFLMCMSMSGFAFAHEGDWNRHLGSYAELSLGTNAYYLASGFANGAGIDGVGAGAALGYNFAPGFALEAGVIPSFTENLNGTLITPYLTTRYNIPMADRTNIILKLGAMAPQAAIVLPFTGIGISYAVSPKVDVSIQYQGAVYGIAGAGLAGLGLTYHFD